MFVCIFNWQTKFWKQKFNFPNPKQKSANKFKSATAKNFFPNKY